MVPARQVDIVTHTAEILLRIEAVTGELHRYYKFERHRTTAPEMPYFLLSHCANLLFSLWLTQDGSPAGVFLNHWRLAPLLDRLDFDTMRHIDYTRRSIDDNTYEEHLKNEPQWFQFWMKALEEADGTGIPEARDFTQQVLDYANLPGFLDGRMPRKKQKALNTLMQGDEAGQLLRRSISLLENMQSATSSYLIDRGPKNYMIEQTISVYCLLSQIRRTIVYETPAQGPSYALCAARNWGLPSSLGRLLAGKPHGFLRVVPRRDGGQIVCTYAWTSKSESKRRSWTRDVSALSQSYEAELFNTWPRETDEHPCNDETTTQAEACWKVQTTEANRIKALVREVEAVLQRLADHPSCSALVEDIAPVLRKNEGEWKGAELAWSYVKQLDQLLDKLSTAYRDAKVLGGHNPGAEIIPNTWPPTSSEFKRPSNPSENETLSWDNLISACEQVSGGIKPKDSAESPAVEEHTLQCDVERTEQCAADEPTPR